MRMGIQMIAIWGDDIIASDIHNGNGDDEYHFTEVMTKRTGRRMCSTNHLSMEAFLKTNRYFLQTPLWMAVPLSRTIHSSPRGAAWNRRISSSATEHMRRRIFARARWLGPCRSSCNDCTFTAFSGVHCMDGIFRACMELCQQSRAHERASRPALLGWFDFILHRLVLFAFLGGVG